MPYIQITCDTPDAQIYYSTDGSDPSILYSNSFELEEECTIKAVGKKEGLEPSDITEKLLERTQGYLDSANPFHGYVTVGKESSNINFFYRINNNGFSNRNLKWEAESYDPETGEFSFSYGQTPGTDGTVKYKFEATGYLESEEYIFS